MELVIAPDGTVMTLYHELFDIAAVGGLSIARASQVEPDAHGQWTAQILDGPLLGPFPTRSAALRDAHAGFGSTCPRARCVG